MPYPSIVTDQPFRIDFSPMSILFLNRFALSVFLLPAILFSRAMSAHENFHSPSGYLRVVGKWVKIESHFPEWNILEYVNFFSRRKEENFIGDTRSGCLVSEENI